MFIGDKNTEILVETFKGFISTMDDQQKIYFCKKIGLPVQNPTHTQSNTLTDKYNRAARLQNKHFRRKRRN